ncbi:helix-turn-helix domain-containing protein [Roseibium sp. SCPC15]|uniref:helix-turn-helix domain-containing protein n=1 Tax=Roseibium sp. SCP15 TaxID=3141376 RepID=UPI003339C5CF
MDNFEYFDEAPSELARGNVPEKHGVLLEHHVPETMDETFHYHPSIEVNFMNDCEMTYSFSGREVHVKPGKFVVFWAAYPHRVTNVIGQGTITNAYVQLSEFLQWPLPKEFVNLLLAGAVITNGNPDKADNALTSKWAREASWRTRPWRAVHTLEVQARLARLAIAEPEILMPPVYDQEIGRHHQNLVIHFDTMLRFIAENYARPITQIQVAEAANISSNHATTIFRKFLGCTVKQHINNVRLFHAKMMLAESDVKILTVALDSGFGSVSAFYEVFRDRMGMSPAAFRHKKDAA